MKMKIRNKAAFTDEVTPLEEENARVSYEAALEGIVLLENDGTLPIVPGKVALYGAGAGMTIKGGTGSGEVNERHAVSILEGMEAAGFTVTTKNWLTRYEEEYRRGEEEYAAEFRRRMLKLDVVNMMGTPYQHPFGDPVTIEDVNESDTDTCIYVIARQAGESADRKLKNFEYSLSDEEKANLAMCAANYEKMIVVINVGSVFDMSFLDEIAGIGAVVYYAQQGMKGGNAFADLICGKVSPSAKTVDTWPEKYEDIPFAMDYSYLNGDVDQEYYREGIYVGYRYFDSYDVEPRYPFGYGLSYTDFSIEAETVTAAGGKVTVSAKVTNTGSTYAGREVVQLYVSCPKSGMAKEYQKLAAFAKTEELKPGESTNVLLTFAMEELASYREEDAAYVLEKGDYILRAGASSRDTSAAAVLVLDEDIVTEQCDNICPTVLEVKEMEPPMLSDTADEQDTDLERIPVKAADIATAGHLYEEPEIYSSPVTDAVLNVLTEEELCDVVTGAGAGGNRAKFFDAPGSAGYTTGELLDKGLPNVCLADGPAGLRLQKTSAVTRSGKLKGVEPMLSAMNYVPEAMKKIMLGNPEKHPCVYQFATSFPTGLALAQSWNTALAERVGKAVGKEMERYGVTYWLAPGMNIHRNPLCGRNFEYYSEDPLLSGKMAAAMSKGVQSRRGCYVTIKHFCCNNQEDNRNHTNANVNERALREIYLRGFRIAVQEGHAKALMTSYNKVNGTYANNSYDLITKVLRNEWGFDGVVMTDWFATGKDVGSHSAAIEAGNDLIMPGGKGVVRELKKKLKTGELDKTSLRRCAANVIRGITGSRIYQAYRRMYGEKESYR
ncbi:beta-glucosidase [Mediterraneibacter glycyrrhizinilyticus]|uniref:beta-glucosidase n=1 Tax=Mediterraneibacter glycyrrhizinilyticus TaxID=342942 RepID=UPI0025A36A32|nr:glycoside hydrolase family 3 N-terminal domain-containing protein [Mediterraneibacter glycyrrhizinilyticus]MDM8126344.1 glycoside hydrolase family 3 N-terminal domain-containing protein [Mediterraneibacter glycyrrhizinilyticus]